MNPIRVAICDDHKLVVGAFENLIDAEPSLKVVHKSYRGEALLEFLEKETADVVLLDYSMPGKGGKETAEEILTKIIPQPKVVMLTMHEEPHIIQELIKAGVHGYVLKENTADELLICIQEVIEHGEYFSREVNKLIRSGLKTEDRSPAFGTSLTTREQEVLESIAKGYSSKEAGEKLFIAATTVETHKRNIMDKLQVKNIRELLMKAVQLKLINPEFSSDT
ncbi:MAG: response regulator transcription factor [Bacteroidota bacterium]